MDDSSNISNVVVGCSGTTVQMKHQTKPKSTTRISSGSNKSKKKPIKVVYISNPMKVTASASEFRALVQQLTGQDADDVVDLPDLHPTHHDNNDNNPEQVELSSSRRNQQANTSSSPQFDDHDHDQQYMDADVDGLFVPEMLVDNFVPAPSRQGFPLI